MERKKIEEKDKKINFGIRSRSNRIIEEIEDVLKDKLKK